MKQFSNTDPQPKEIQWSALLEDAVKRPGAILEAYSNFHNYSIGNCILAAFQCHARGIPVGPIATYQRWRELGRQVRRGAKALTLCMPISVKRRNGSEAAADGDDESREAARFTMFVYKRRWFVLAQTDGDDYQLPPIPAWDKAAALAKLEISEEPFQHLNGNVQGYAKPGRIVAINPAAQLPHKTLFHELGHQLLDHVSEADRSETETLSRNLEEAEAEAVALICCEALDLPGATYCRGYIQDWLRGGEIPERSCQRIFAAANKVLEAGKVGEE